MAGHDDDSGRMPPLPVRSRPVAGESVSSYVRRLAVANHLRPSYLRGYLAGPPRYLGPIQPGRLAVLSGRTVAVLERTLTGLARHTWPAAQARPPAAPRRHTRAADKPALFAAIRRDAQDGDPIRILATRYQVHRRMIRQALADPTPPPRKQPPQRATPVLDRLRGPITTMLTGVTGRVQYGPLVHASTALAVCANYLPVARAAKLVAALTGVSVSAGFTATIRGKAAARLGPFMDQVRVLLRAAGVLYADETPARVAGHLHYVHVACTEFLTAMHTGDRTKEAINAGGVLAGYAGTIVRDGYKGYEHLTDALHAWCGAHGLRDLAGLYRFDPDGQLWPAPWPTCSSTRTPPRPLPAAAAGPPRRGAARRIRARYRGAVAKGITDNQCKRTQIGKDGLRLARRFRACEDMIMRFTTDLAVGFTSNQAERDVRPVKVQMRTSGGCWRTLTGLADFAIVQSYLSTAGKWGIDALDALTRLFTGQPWLPPSTAPP